LTTTTGTPTAAALCPGAGTAALDIAVGLSRVADTFESGVAAVASPRGHLTAAGTV